jgi:hypothetical protein
MLYCIKPSRLTIDFVDVVDSSIALLNSAQAFIHSSMMHRGVTEADGSALLHVIKFIA